MEIKVIKNQSDYERALKHLSDLMDQNLPLHSEDENALELLLLVIKDYEQKISESTETDPIEAIKFRLDQMQLTKKDLIPHLGSASRVSEVLSGKRSLSLSMICKLHEALGIPLESLVVNQRSPRKVLRKRVKQPRKKSFFYRKKKRLPR